MRLPDYVIIGVMKSGTTTLYRWIVEQPEALPARKKEIHYFSRYWDRGLDWYASYFAHVPEGQLAGEASPTYTHADFGDLPARRMAGTLPDARLLCVVRDPVARIRSHHLHDVRKGRTRVALADAVRDPGNPYVALSLYHQRLAPFMDHFPRQQLCIVRLEDLVDPGAGAWAEVLAHLGLPPRPAPATAHNVGAEGVAYGRVLGQFAALKPWRWPRGYRALRNLPGPVRAAGKRLLTRSPSAVPRDGGPDGAPLPAEVLATVWDDVGRLEARLGLDRELWPRARR